MSINQILRIDSITKPAANYVLTTDPAHIYAFDDIGGFPQTTQPQIEVLRRKGLSSHALRVLPDQARKFTLQCLLHMVHKDDWDDWLRLYQQWLMPAGAPYGVALIQHGKQISWPYDVLSIQAGPVGDIESGVGMLTTDPRAVTVFEFTMLARHLS